MTKYSVMLLLGSTLQELQDKMNKYLNSYPIVLISSTFSAVQVDEVNKYLGSLSFSYNQEHHEKIVSELNIW